MCVCVCVCEREREDKENYNDGNDDREILTDIRQLHMMYPHIPLSFFVDRTGHKAWKPTNICSSRWCGVG